MEVSQEKSVFDYSFVGSPARIALYDDLKAAPRITRIEPAPTTDYIEHLTTTVYEQSKLAGGKIPYSVIREVSENFIHAQFQEVVVSILDEGNTIRFADQGPGIQEKEKATKPGFSSAIEPMKNYIRGVGSGFPIVKDYLDDREGAIIIEDNIVSGAVVTITLNSKDSIATSHQAYSSSTRLTPTNRPAPIAFTPHIPLSEREKSFLIYFLHEGDLGVTDIRNLSELPNSTIHNTIRKLEEAGLIEFTIGKKRGLTELGRQIALSLKME